MLVQCAPGPSSLFRLGILAAVLLAASQLHAQLTLTEVPADLTLACGTALPTDLPRAVGGCEGDIAVVLTVTSTPGSCTAEREYLRRFTVADTCGGSASAVQRVTYVDTVAPTWLGIPPSVELACGADVPTTAPTARDVCDAEVNVSYSTSVAGVEGCTGRANLVRRWTATDDCGNRSTATQLVAFVDVEAPRLEGIPRDLAYDCVDDIAIATPTATDDCDPAPSVTFADVTEVTPCGYRTTRTWTATDACGNTATGSHLVIVEDQLAPDLAADLPDLEVACGEAWSPPDLNVRDACDPDPAITETVVPVAGAGACGETGVFDRIFAVRDACGNVAEARQRVFVVDRTPPTIAVAETELEVVCGIYDLDSAQPATSDGCGDGVAVAEERRDTTVTRDGVPRDAVLRTWTASDACGNVATATQLVVYAGDAAHIRAVRGGKPLASGAPICAGDLVELTAPAGADAYLWNTGATTRRIEVAAELDLAFAVSWSGGTCSGGATYDLDVRPVETFTLADVDEVYCEGRDVVLAVDTEIEGVRWTGPLGFAEDGTRVSVDAVGASQSGYYVASAVAEGTGCAYVDSTFVNVEPGACVEVCDNGIDDDGDGRVDCDDRKCGCCAISAATFRTECNDAGTQDDGADDTYRVFVTLDAAGVGVGGITVSGSATLASVYPTTELLLGEWPWYERELTFSFADNGDVGCTLLDQRVESPGPCTPGCVLQVLGTEVGECERGQYTLAVQVASSTQASGELGLNGKVFALTSGIRTATYELTELSCTGAADAGVSVAFSGADCAAAATYEAPCAPLAGVPPTFEPSAP